MAQDAAMRTAFDEAVPLTIRQIGVGDLKEALKLGYEDFLAKPSHMIFLTILYPIIGVILAMVTSNADLMPLLFPLAAGFALLGPFLALGLYELSRRREQGLPISWSDALEIRHSPAVGSILALGLALTALFMAWLVAAQLIALATISDTMADKAVMASYSAFLGKILGTPAGWALIAIGNLVGFGFAMTAFCVSVVAFPLLLDRNVGARVAVATSVRAVTQNPLTMAVWGLIVAVSLALGTLPFFIGLAVAVPILGHATWHLYRKLVVRQ